MAYRFVTAICCILTCWPYGAHRFDLELWIQYPSYIHLGRNACPLLPYLGRRRLSNFTISSSYPGRMGSAFAANLCVWSANPEVRNMLFTNVLQTRIAPRREVKASRYPSELNSLNKSRSSTNAVGIVSDPTRWIRVSNMFYPAV